jgi:signal transduction histidine kinase
VIGEPEPRAPRVLSWLAAGVTWLGAGITIMTGVVRPAGAQIDAWLSLGCWLTFGAAFLAMHRSLPCRPRGILWLGLQTIAALFLNHYDHVGTDVALLVMTAAETLAVVSPLGAAAWILMQTTLFVGPTAYLHQWGVVTIARVAGAVLGFQIFGVAAIAVAVGHARAREELAHVHAELQAAQGRLAEVARTAERLRLSRELHDTLGHHLTALNLKLEVARHVASGKALTEIEGAQGVARLLLAEVRDVVSATREDAPFDLATALHLLVADIPTPQIHLSVSPEAALPPSPAAAHAVLRCVQEVVTNTVRHAGAANLWIEVAAGSDGMRVHAHDDGRGADGVRPGNGLRGMRERLEQAGGRLQVETSPGGGFEVTALVREAS